MITFLIVWSVAVLLIIQYLTFVVRIGLDDIETKRTFHLMLIPFGWIVLVLENIYNVYKRLE